MQEENDKSFVYVPKLCQNQDSRSFRLFSYTYTQIKVREILFCKLSLNGMFYSICATAIYIKEL